VLGCWADIVAEGLMFAVILKFLLSAAGGLAKPADGKGWKGFSGLKLPEYG